MSDERYPRYADLKGELCRVVVSPGGNLVAEVFRADSWVKDPGIGVVDLDFEGHTLSRAEAELFLAGPR